MALGDGFRMEWCWLLGVLVLGRGLKGEADEARRIMGGGGTREGKGSKKKEGTPLKCTQMSFRAFCHLPLRFVHFVSLFLSFFLDVLLNCPNDLSYGLMKCWWLLKDNIPSLI